MDDMNKYIITMQIVGILIGLGIIGFVIWVVIKVMQHFAII
jgi:flagellar biogenesis protein FliO